MGCAVQWYTLIYLKHFPNIQCIKSNQFQGLKGKKVKKISYRWIFIVSKNAFFKNYIVLQNFEQNYDENLLFICTCLKEIDMHFKQ